VRTHPLQGKRRTRVLLAGLVAVATAAGTGLTASAATTPTAQQQLTWLTDASAHLPIPAAEETAHLSASFLTGIGGPDVFNQTLAQFGPLTVLQTLSVTPTEVDAVTDTTQGTAEVKLAVDTSGLVAGLQFSPYASIPTSWSQIDARLRALAPQVSFASSVIEPDGDCRVVHGVSADTQRPLGSAFKLYVLGALGNAVATHKASWSQDLAINDAWKSLPSGTLQNEPAGTELTLQQYADAMISISDNTAADHLIHFLGRDAVGAQLYRFGNQRPSADLPLMTTREMFALKGVQYPKLADTYLALPKPLRPAALDAADRIPLTDVSAWTTPKDIDQIEWFGSPTDICKAFAGLWHENAQPGLSPIGAALSINDGGLGLDPAQYPTVWFKGGSEPGVLTLNYLVKTASGQLVATSVMLGDQHADINEWQAASEGFAIIKGSLALTGTAGH
jgi:beta-lactamase class A